MNATASVNGRSRVQKLNPTVTALPRNGTCTSAPSEMFDRVKTPIDTFGSPSVNPAERPSDVTSRNGGSENPSNGINSGASRRTRG